MICAHALNLGEAPPRRLAVFGRRNDSRSLVVRAQYAEQVLVQLSPSPLGHRLEECVCQSSRDAVESGDLPASSAGQRDHLAATIGRVEGPRGQLAGLQVVDGGGDVARIKVHAAPEFELRGRRLFQNGENRHVPQSHSSLGQAVVQLALGDPCRL